MLPPRDARGRHLITFRNTTFAPLKTESQQEQLHWSRSTLPLYGAQNLTTTQRTGQMGLHCHARFCFCQWALCTVTLSRAPPRHTETQDTAHPVCCDAEHRDYAQRNTYIGHPWHLLCAVSPTHGPRIDAHTRIQTASHFLRTSAKSSESDKAVQSDILRIPCSSLEVRCQTK